MSDAQMRTMYHELRARGLSGQAALREIAELTGLPVDEIDRRVGASG